MPSAPGCRLTGVRVPSAAHQPGTGRNRTVLDAALPLPVGPALLAPCLPLQSVDPGQDGESAYNPQERHRQYQGNFDLGAHGIILGLSGVRQEVWTARLDAPGLP
jgi:hypothetical protein